MRLFIAEKPALAKIIAEALGSVQRCDGYYQCGVDVVTWCIGHLLELAPPETHNPSYAKWRKADLPLKLRPAKYQPIERTAPQFSVVAKLLRTADSVVHAGDPDDEGQLLIDEVLTYCQYQNPVMRVLINDLNTAAAKKAIANLRDNKEFFGLSQKALARSIGDQLYGFNMTRAYTLAAQEKGIEGVLSVGRVQTPILGLIVNRYNAFKNHTAASFYTLTANITINGHAVTPRYVVLDGALVDEKGRLIDEAAANCVAAGCQNQEAIVSLCDTQEKKTPPPLPFSLLDLQAAMSRRFNLSAQQTLDITQILREKHKAITYNRSDCSYLSDDQFNEAPETLAAIVKALPVLSSAYANADRTHKGRAFDDSKVTAHTAIIPTTTAPNIAAMNDAERKVYQAIAEQYLVQFLPHKHYLATKASFAVNGYTFAATATKTTQDGWTTLLSPLEENDDEDDNNTSQAFAALSALAMGDAGHCRDVTVAQEKTKPQPLYTEATLLKDLQRVAKYVKDPKIRQLLKNRDEGKAGENGGIGTPATRASMLEVLQKRGFYITEKKKIIPTQKGIEFIASLPEIATAPDMTALWHEQQQEIAKGQLTVETFLDSLESFIGEQVSNVQLGGMQGGTTKTDNGKGERLKSLCPSCGGSIVISPKLYACTGCKLRVWIDIAGKKLSHTQAESLFATGKTGVIKGFNSKAGKKFDAALLLDIPNNQAKFDFSVKERAARTGRNPSTGAAIEIAASKTVAFKVGSKLKEAING
jgi:DNA topoisomerase-3